MSFNLFQQCRRSGARRMLYRDKPDDEHSTTDQNNDYLGSYLSRDGEDIVLDRKINDYLPRVVAEGVLLEP
jgi:hypothetical protein